MSNIHQLSVRVNHELLLDAGRWEEPPVGGGTGVTILPPKTTLFRQVLAYLESMPDPSIRPSGSRIGREGVAAAAVTLRWGSYFSVLADRTKPLWSDAIFPGSPMSRISDGEMARINIEASAAMAEWVDLYRRHAGTGHYAQLAERAVAYLPMPQRTSRRRIDPFLALVNPGVADAIEQTTPAKIVARARRDAELHPSRLFANALVNHAWRNGPVEGIHAGRGQGYPVDHRRLTPGEERMLFKLASQRMTAGMSALLACTYEGSRRSWHDQVLPYGLAGVLLITPADWTLSETSREIRLQLPTTTHLESKSEETAA